MRLLKYLLVALLALVPPASAGWLPLSDNSGTPVSNACATASGTTVTFTAQGTGGASSNRITVVTINWSDSTNAGTAQLTAMTVGGISMTKATAATTGVTNSNSEIWYAVNPTGTTANIVATFATAVDGVTIEVYNLAGFIIAPLTTTIGTTSVSQLHNNKQIALATASRTTNVSTSLSNMINDFSSACGSNLWGVHASQRLTGNNQTLTSAISPTSNNPKIALAVWGSTVDCTIAAAPFLARTSGLDGTHTTAYTNLICGLIADGVWQKLDMLHIYATQNSTTALLNLVQNAYNGTAIGSPTFTTDRGFTGVEASSTVYIDTGLNPTVGSTLYTRNSAHISVWNLNNATSNNGVGSNGSNPATQATYILCRLSDGKAYFRVNNGATVGDNATTADALGHYIASRDDSATVRGYKIGIQIEINTGSGSDVLTNLNLYSLGFNNNGTAKGSNNQMAEISAGAALNATDAINFYNRLRTYMTAVGVP